MTELFPEASIESDAITTSYKQSVTRIAEKIRRMKARDPTLSWKNITDCLRATLRVKTADKLLDVIRILQEQPSVEILRIKSRFGAKKNLNDIVINFEYGLIGELIVQYLPDDVSRPTEVLLQANRLIYDIKKIYK